MKTKIIILMILITAFAVFVSQNTNIIPVEVFFWQFRISTIVLICLVFLIGLIAGFVIAGLFNTKKRDDEPGSD